MTTRKKSEPSAFFLSFVGEYVQVVTSFNMATESEGSEVGLPLIVEGYILDADEGYIYMGADSQGIRQAIRLDYVVFVQILEKQSELEEIFSSVPNVKKRDMN
jgi:hypothetical protein